VALAAAILFAARSDVVGYRLLTERRVEAIHAFYAMQHGMPVQAEPRMQSFFPHAAVVLEQSLKTGTYCPPHNP
jgi:hypothetical protein